MRSDWWLWCRVHPGRVPQASFRCPEITSAPRAPDCVPLDLFTDRSSMSWEQVQLMKACNRRSHPAPSTHFTSTTVQIVIVPSQQHPMPTTHQSLPSSTTSWAEHQGFSSSHTHPKDSYTAALELTQGTCKCPKHMLWRWDLKRSWSFNFSQGLHWYALRMKMNMHLVNIHFLTVWLNCSPWTLQLATWTRLPSPTFWTSSRIYVNHDIFLIEDVSQLWTIAASFHHAKRHRVNVHAAAGKYSGMFSYSQRY